MHHGCDDINECCNKVRGVLLSSGTMSITYRRRATRGARTTASRLRTITVSARTRRAASPATPAPCRVRRVSWCPELDSYLWCLGTKLYSDSGVLKSHSSWPSGSYSSRMDKNWHIKSVAFHIGNPSIKVWRIFLKGSLTLFVLNSTNHTFSGCLRAKEFASPSPT